MIRRCVRGECGMDHADGSATACRGGCGISLHVATCAQLGKGYAALGNFTCVTCRMREVLQRPGESLTEEQVRLRATEGFESVTERTMVLELSQGKEGTAAGYAEYTRLEEEYTMGMGLVLEGQLLLPRHSAGAFNNFCTWLTLDAERARSLESVVRSAGAFFTKLKLPDVTKEGSVKAHVKDLLTEVGIEHEPATEATPRMMECIVNKLINQRWSDPFIRGRERVQIEAEGLGGCRIGEVAGAGECHGVLANETCIITDPNAEPGSVSHRVVEFKLEHSKTGFSRYLDYTGSTQNVSISAADHLMGYWSLANLKVNTDMQDGMMVQRPDYYVLRVSLLGLDEARFERLLGWASTCRIKAIEYGVKHLQTASKARQRWGARGIGSQEKKFYNLMGGQFSNPDLERGRQALLLKGYEVAVVPGPLLRATTGGARPQATHMPLAVSSTFAPTKELLEKAYEMSMEDPANPDPHLNLRRGEQPKWSTHSLRRLAATTARRHRERSGATVDEIDLYFGWKEKVLKKAMQMHYAGMSLFERMRSARITGWM